MVAGLDYQQVISVNPQPSSDWYGVLSSDSFIARWDSIPSDTRVKYHAGATAGHAPGMSFVLCFWLDSLNYPI